MYKRGGSRSNTLWSPQFTIIASYSTDFTSDELLGLVLPNMMVDRSAFGFNGGAGLFPALCLGLGLAVAGELA